MVYTHALGACVARREGSSPFPGTKDRYANYGAAIFGLADSKGLVLVRRIAALFCAGEQQNNKL